MVAMQLQLFKYLNCYIKLDLLPVNEKYQSFIICKLWASVWKCVLLFVVISHGFLIWRSELSAFGVSQRRWMRPGWSWISRSPPLSDSCPFTHCHTAHRRRKAAATRCINLYFTIQNSVCTSVILEMNLTTFVILLFHITKHLKQPPQICIKIVTLILLTQVDEVNVSLVLKPLCKMYWFFLQFHCNL